MQPAIFPSTAFSQPHAQATRVVRDQTNMTDEAASNDDCYRQGQSQLRRVFAVLANMIGGIVLLSGMYAFPHVLAKILS